MTDLIAIQKIAGWEKLKALVLDSVSSPITKRVYNMALDEFLGRFQQAPRPGFTKATVSAWRVSLEARGLGSSSIIIRMSAIRKLAAEAADNGLLAPELAAGRRGKLRLNQIQPKAVEDWLHTTFDSWWAMHGVRAIMTRVFNYAEGHGLWEEGKRSPSSRAKLGKRRHKRERRILSFEETARILNRLEEPHRLIIETCIATGARISEVLGLKWKHLNLDAATIKIEQRVWHQEISRPKSEDSKRVLGIADLQELYRMKLAADAGTSESFVFQQKRAPGCPLWDSGVRDAVHQAAQADNCDFRWAGTALLPMGQHYLAATGRWECYRGFEDRGSQRPGNDE